MFRSAQKSLSIVDRFNTHESTEVFLLCKATVVKDPPETKGKVGKRERENQGREVMSVK